jgi:serine-type D-Ala-D-Ala carboxypeptidase/endopeptidase (penicillin-binding protein 4)
MPVLALGGIRTVPVRGATLLHAIGAARPSPRSAALCSTILPISWPIWSFSPAAPRQFGYPATWQKAEQAVHQELVRQLGSTLPMPIVQVEGAGLSRDNRVTVRAMLELLTRFRPQAELLKKEHGVAVKTGTLTGVYNLAGYLPDGRAFVILLNQQANNRAAVLDRLKRQFVSRTARTRSANRRRSIPALAEK